MWGAGGVVVDEGILKNADAVRGRRWPVLRAAAPIITLLAIGAIVASGFFELRVVEAIGIEVPIADALWPASWVGFGLVGTLIVVMRPDNRVGWVMVAICGLVSLSLLVTSYGRWDLVLERDAPFAVAARWMAAWLPVPAFGLLAFLILLFPSGFTASRFTRVLARWIVATLALFTVWQALTPVTIAGGFAGAPKYANPWAIDALREVADTATPLFAYVVMFLSLLVLASLPIRFRRARGVERQQLKTFVFAACLIPVLFIGMMVLMALLGVSDEGGAPVVVATFILMFDGLAASIAIAVLKYRLYDIDVVINRTLVYAALTAFLVGIYAGGVLFFRTILDPVTGDNDLAIAASTLAVAALFGPARRRIQGFIDRRFYRSRYDAQRTLESFAARLRDEVDLDAVSRHLLTTLTNTVQPRHVSVWVSGRTR
jgi:hypothetical protein